MGPRGLGLLGLMAWALWLEVVASGDCYDFGWFVSGAHFRPSVHAAC